MLVLVLALSLGLHWALLQTVAWTGMLVRYAQTDNFATAVSKTFDGDHPCPLCVAVEQGRAAERQQDKQATKFAPKLDAGVLEAVTFVLAEPPRAWVCGEDVFSTPRNDDPPKPRPRGLTLPPV